MNKAMKLKQIWSLLLLFSWLANSLLTAQTPSERKRIEASGVFHDGKVLLRWVPSDIDLWKLANQKGYRVTRYMISKDDDELSFADRTASEKVLLSNKVPLDKGSWASFSSNAAKIAATMLYQDEIELQFEGKSDLGWIINTNQARDNRFGFAMLAANQEFEVAENMALGFSDTEPLEQNVTYYYAIEVEGIPISEVTPGGFSIRTSTTKSLPIIQKPYTTAGNKKATLQWNNVGLEQYYLGFNVEKADVGSSNFTKVNTAPIIFGGTEGIELDEVQYGLILPDNNKTFVYRVRGITYFGFDSEPSDTVHVKGKPDPLQADILITDITEVNPGGGKKSYVNISWTFPKQAISEITGFDVLRAKSQEADYVKINAGLLRSDVITYNDNNPMNTNYYKIVAYDKNGYLLSSISHLMQLDDSTPPPTPKDLKGDMDKSGYVTLNWQPSVAEDLRGYRVFVSNHPTENFMEITPEPIMETTYNHQVSMKVMNEKVYFIVKAVDYRENISPRSVVCAIERPDIIPPDAPVITSIVNYGNGIRLEWNLSLAEDVIDYTLERRERGVVGWRKMLKFNPAVAKYYMFDDSTSKKSGTEYDYRLSAKDDVGLIGDSRIMTIKAMNAHKRQMITRVGSQFYQWQPSSTFFWHISHGANSTNTAEVLSFEIYRAVDDPQKNTLLKVIPVNTAMATFNLMTTPYNQDPNYKLFTTMAAHGYGFSYAMMDDVIDFSSYPALTYYWVPIVQPNGLQAWVKYNLPAGFTGTEHLVYYRVIAKYNDGSSSPISSYTMTTIK